MKLLLADAKRDDLAVMTSFFASGQVVPVIDGCFPLGEAAAALRRVGEKQSRGKVVISAMAGH